MENRCICCGVIIPEGRDVCPKCVYGSKVKPRNLEEELGVFIEDIPVELHLKKDKTENLVAFLKDVHSYILELIKDNRRLAAQNRRLKVYDEERDILLRTRLVREAQAETANEYRTELKYTLAVDNCENYDYLDYAYTMETIDKIAEKIIGGKNGT